MSDISGSKPKPPDVKRLLEALSRHGVEFVLIGGLAGIAHGSAYPTYDLDIAYDRSRPNLHRLVAALEEIGVTLRGAPADLPFLLEAKTLERGANFTFETPHGSLDILGHVPGVSSFAELTAESAIEEIAGVPIHVASIDHLIAMKRAADRPKDRLMLEEYLVIADEQERARQRGE